MLRALLLAAFLQADWQGEGLKALDEKRYQDALAIFNKAAAADPKDYTAHFHLGLAYSFLNQDAEATREYRETLKLKPGLYQAELNLGIVLLRQNGASEALPLLEHAAASKPDAFRPVFFKAEAQLAAGDAQASVATYKQALLLDPKAAAAEAGLGRALARTGQLDSAAEHFGRAASLDPAYKDALLELGELYEKAGRNPEAAALYAQFPGNAAAQERAGQLLLTGGKATEAIPLLEAAVQKSPTSANRMALAAAYLREKQKDKALAVVAQALQSDPNNFDLRMLAGRMLRDERKFPEASSQFFAATKLNEAAAPAWSELAGACIMAEKYREALAALDKVKALGAENAGHNYFRAIVLDKLHQLQPALDSYRKFLELSQNQRPDEEFKARQRVRILERELSKK